MTPIPVSSSRTRVTAVTYRQERLTSSELGTFLAAVRARQERSVILRIDARIFIRLSGRMPGYKRGDKQALCMDHRSYWNFSF